MIKIRRARRTFGDGLIEDEVKGLCEEWMIHADRVLEDEQLITIFFEALGKRHPKSKSRGREGNSAETVMRLMILKHIRNWSYVTLCQASYEANCARIFQGDTRSEGKIFSIFEPTTEIICKGKAGKPNEFGKVVKIKESENQIVVDCEVYDQRPGD